VDLGAWDPGVVDLCSLGSRFGTSALEQDIRSCNKKGCVSGVFHAVQAVARAGYLVFLLVRNIPVARKIWSFLQVSDFKLRME
jgi:hypothetical protein